MNIDAVAITNAKILLEIPDTDYSKDTLLTLLGTEAETTALALTNNQDVLFDDVLLARMIQHAYNHNNAEGISSQSVAGVSESYIYPTNITKALRAYNKVKVL